MYSLNLDGKGKATEVKGEIKKEKFCQKLLGNWLKSHVGAVIVQEYLFLPSDRLRGLSQHLPFVWT